MAGAYLVAERQAYSAAVHRSTSVVFAIALAFGCAHAKGRVLAPSGFTEVVWTEVEKQQEIAVRTLRAAEHASHHLVRLAGSEIPHVHERSDLTVFVLEGRVRMNLGSRRLEIRAGDVVEVPRGTPHFAENLAGEASVAYTVFSPPFDKSDVKTASSP